MPDTHRDRGLLNGSKLLGLKLWAQMTSGPFPPGWLFFLEDRDKGTGGCGYVGTLRAPGRWRWAPRNLEARRRLPCWGRAGRGSINSWVL